MTHRQHWKIFRWKWWRSWKHTNGSLIWRVLQELMTVRKRWFSISLWRRIWRKVGWIIFLVVWEVKNVMKWRIRWTVFVRTPSSQWLLIGTIQIIRAFRNFSNSHPMPLEIPVAGQEWGLPVHWDLTSVKIGGILNSDQMYSIPERIVRRRVRRWPIILWKRKSP